MLDTAIRTQLEAYLKHLRQPIELVASLEQSPKSAEMLALLQEIGALSDQVSVRVDGSAERRPSFCVGRVGEAGRVHFAGIPLGHELSSLVLALLHVGGHPPKADASLLAGVQRMVPDAGRCRFEVYVSLSCHNCPDVVQALNTMAALNPAIETVMVDGALFEDEVEARGIMAVPSVYLNGAPFGQGRMGLEEIVAKLDSAGAAREAEQLEARPPYDVLIVGGGPAGAAAALYAARKGIRTGIVTERFGGQVLDTLGIDNFVSVPHTEGPRFVAAMEQQVRAYDVDIMASQRAEGLTEPDADGIARVRLANGASLRSRSVILAPGARWREMNVPGESEYKGQGVCFCPHCDGPLFKGKRVAVIGGGNSGVEAAIDLAGIVSHVSLLEFDGKLRADAVLQAKLRDLPNVTVMTSAQTTELTGDGFCVTGLVYRDRIAGAVHRIELEGIFVQIGLLPNTDWLDGVVALSSRREIEVDARGETSVPGIFAAGDATTVPYKQIVIAAGEGAKASLSAFDYLIRRPSAAAPKPVEESLAA